MAYLFSTKNGRSLLYDDVTRISIIWKNGRFNETQKINTDEVKLPKENPEMFLARKLREMADYIAENYCEFV